MAQNGRKMLLKIDDGSGNYQTIAGMQENTLTLENGEIDITNKDSNAKRELLAGGTQNVSFSGSGVYYGADAASQTLFKRAQQGSIDQYRMEFEDGEQIDGMFQVGNYERTGEQSNAVMFSCELRSSGGADFTAPGA